MKDTATMGDRGLVTATVVPRESFKESCLRATVHKYRAVDLERAFASTMRLHGGLHVLEAGHFPSHQFPDRGVEPYEVCEGDGNALVYGGASAFFDLLIGAANVTEYDNTNAYLGVGTSTTAWAATQTDLLGTDNRQGMEATYPLHTDGTGSSNDSCIWKSQWGTSEANVAWQEWALFNHATAGRMLNRKVESFGTKTSAAIWTLTVTLDLS